MKTTKTIIFSSLVATTIFFTGCSFEKENNLNLENEVTSNTSQIEEPVENQNEIIIKEPIPTENKNTDKEPATKIEQEESITDSLNYKNEFGLEVKNNEIYFYDKKRGWASENRIFLTFKDNIYSFKYNNGIDKLGFHPIENFESVVYYDGLTINLPKDDDIEIVYQCNGPLLRGRPYEYCETNGNDYLQQYEFGGAYRQFSTGGGFSLAWRKIFIKKVNNENVIFESGINSAFIDIDSSFIPLESLEVYKSLLKYGLVEDLHLNTELKNTAFKNNQEKIDFEKLQIELKPIHTEMRDVVKSKKYLDKIKDEAINLENENRIKDLIESFEIEKK